MFDQILASQELQIALGVGLLLGVVGTLLIALLVSVNNQKKRAEERQLMEEDKQRLQTAIHELEKSLVKAESRIEDHIRLQAELKETQQSLQNLERENATVRAQFKSERGHFEEQLATLKSAKESLTKEFENIANKIFEAKQQQFKQSSQSTLEVTINPLKEQIKEFRKQVEDAYHKENAERNKLVGQISELQKQAQQIGQDAVNLASALKGSNKSQGNWGEVILERLLEDSGLHKGREYETQVSLKDEEGNRRNPDVIIRLPENKDIVVDAKVSLVHYEKFCSSEEDAERQSSLKQHVASIRAHIDGLSRKNYENLETIRTLDFVFIFVPIEAAFMLAMEHDRQLFQYAYDKHIVLVSPTTLMATLRTVENIWRYEKQNKNAEQIANMAGGLHDQFVLVINALDDLGSSIQKTQTAYDTARARLQTGRGNLHRKIQQLEKLGAKTKKQLPKLRDEQLLSLEATESDSEQSADVDIEVEEQSGD